MIEDKLTQDERLRLECVAQAVAFTSAPGSQGDLLTLARQIEKYIKNG